MKKQRGQGTVEYAGAIVLAAILVATVLVANPFGADAMFQNILTTVSQVIKKPLSNMK